jgi:hypothetical protein
MPIDLIGAVVAWLVALSGDTGIRLLRGSRDKRMMHDALSVAVGSVVEQADPAVRGSLQAALSQCFSAPLLLQVDISAPIGVWLRSAITEQVMHLENWVNNESGRPFREYVPVDLALLAQQLADAIIVALRQVVALGGLTALVQGVDTAEVLARLDALGLQVSRLETARSVIAEARQGSAEGVSSQAEQGTLAPVPPSGAPHPRAASKGDWVDAVMAFPDIEDPEFRRTVLRLMGDQLRLGHSFAVSYRSVARDHVIEIVGRCWDFKDPQAGRRALADALAWLRPDDKAATHLAQMAEDGL